ncbi:conserved hypothetical protein [Aspergillus terreus NIH2624]|uniref:Survival Motor Neuron Gemin2-binding domain-containing protein n=1 Tax=Aspergillus terreus (strain NIH 2624 / FGSC A1156) TaxID=341663 RepID=Q0CL47_ASPTN|nr:uncharacterized protein ATEG_05587 [Aspergillus terreus NIH2624]EAU34656.1 conserved hypothetical protein [Aspergillus terreus NIH2624]
MGKNKNATKPLTQEEIWDDSALVQSWDEAVEEYKLYHSIHARGENVEDVLREAEAAELEKSQDQEEEPEVDSKDAMEADVEPPATAPQTSHLTAPQTAGESAPPIGAHAGGPSMGSAVPQVALAQVQDEGLKNLMMAWYYAGYYTGLYEGQQRANNTNPNQPGN